MDKKIIIVGGGVAGMFAGIAAAKDNNEVIIFEKNEKLGRKMLITGKGRCNLTNNSDMDGFMRSIPGNARFLYSAFSILSPEELMKLFSDGGVDVKIERGNRVFPSSDKSSDIVDFLERHLRSKNVSIRLGQKVDELIIEDGEIKGVLVDKHRYLADKIIVATGGLSYPATGSNGDGYKWAIRAGHKIEKTFPSLVPLIVAEDYVKELEGLSLRNIEVTLYDQKKLASEFGEMVFTDFGLSGPVILTISRFASKYFRDNDGQLKLSINLKPALSMEQLDSRLLRDFDSNPKKMYKNLLADLLPQKLIAVFIKLSKIDPNKVAHQINKEDRKQILQLLTNFEFTVTGTRPIKEAIITAGGIKVKEINPKTMESKKMSNIYFCGEVLDVDGYTGGYNIQIAASTGYVAGLSAGE